MANAAKGKWEALRDRPLIGCMRSVRQEGKVLTFDTDSLGRRGARLSTYDVHDPVIGTFINLPNNAPTNIFGSAATILSGTSEILIGGGDACTQGCADRGVNHTNVLDNDDMSFAPTETGPMNHARCHPSMVAAAQIGETSRKEYAV